MGPDSHLNTLADTTGTIDTVGLTGGRCTATDTDFVLMEAIEPRSARNPDFTHSFLRAEQM